MISDTIGLEPTGGKGIVACEGVEVPKVSGLPRVTAQTVAPHMRPWIEGGSHWFQKPARPELNAEGEAVIGKTLDHRKVGRRCSYLIKWEGFPEEEDEWLPV